MEHRNRHSEPLDQLIDEVLRERLGPPPSREVWDRIAKEVAPSPAPRRSTLASLIELFHAPVTQSALIVAMLVVIVVQPAFYWIHKDYPVNPMVLPYAPRSRPLPESELRRPDLSAQQARSERPRGQQVLSFQILLPPAEAQ